MITENNISGISDVYALLRGSFKDILQELMEAGVGWGTRRIRKASILFPKAKCIFNFLISIKPIPL